MEKIKCEKCGAMNISKAKYCCECGYEIQEQSNREQFNQVTPSHAVETTKKGNSKSLIGIIAGVLFFFVAYFAVQQLFFKAPLIDKVLMESANEINKTCPIMLDSETRLDNTMALPDKVFQYTYTLVNWEKSSIDTVELKKLIEPQIINSVKTNPQMKYQRENKITMSFYYKDKNGLYVCCITVTPKQYG